MSNNANTNSIKFTEIVNATLHADNSDDTARTYAIGADVYYNGHNADSIQGGSVTLPAMQVVVATFSEDRNGSLFLNFTGAESERAAVLSAVTAFCNGVRAHSGDNFPVSL